LIHVTLSVIILRRRLGGLGGQRLIISTLKVILATALMGLVAYLVMRILSAAREPQGLLDRAALVFLPSAAGAVAYIALARVLRIREFQWFVQSIRGRMRR
jgi:putative peptidoglycan lipid II flippase